MHYRFVVVGAGLAGCTVAERIANVLREKVLVLDKRKHVGGNVYDEYNEHGLLVHRYGPHIFHTNSEKVFRYLSQFTEWRHYQHRVRAFVDGKFVPFPINLDTINMLYGTAWDSFEVKEFLKRVAPSVDRVRNSRDVIVSKVGEELYEKFFKNYTYKQWGRYPEELDPSVCGRIPVRCNRDDRYFTDRYQGIPKHGYTRMIERMLANPNISIWLGVDFREVRDSLSYEHLIFTGPIDEFFDHAYGPLPYRSLRFDVEVLEEVCCQDVATINYPNDYDFTRVTEMKHLTGQEHRRTVLVYEYPSAHGEPYYPVPSRESQALYRKYEALADTLPNVHFIGRLGTYRYYNMDQVVAQALQFFESTLATA